MCVRVRAFLEGVEILSMYSIYCKKNLNVLQASKRERIGITFCVVAVTYKKGNLAKGLETAREREATKHNKKLQ